MKRVLHRGAAWVALAGAVGWGAGCASTAGGDAVSGSGAASPSGSARTRAANAGLYDAWYDPSAVVLPPPPAAAPSGGR